MKTYGPQHWWPGETPFEVMVGAVLTQNTAWTNVEKAIANLKQLFMNTLPKDARLYNEDHALIVCVGKEYCKKQQPLCGGCPLKKPWLP